MDSYKLQHRSRASLLYTNYDSIGQLFVGKPCADNGTVRVVPGAVESGKRSLVASSEARRIGAAQPRVQQQRARDGEECTVAQIRQKKRQQDNGGSREPVREGEKSSEEEHACHLSMHQNSAWFST
ncbi:hypothetical protein JOB18_010464 [Solea senegalensis]|uniref:Uncharacterized protein n=1 Tax=Solea senegalensis TaxID=28829 RepID=A0AAV6R246_SOLSE|nr:hypothetical protein JOB18_010464 [Solea senegalensis]KAG7498493.1 hypothetical protein JOB18_010464 [Solea senegalensis]KAG7498495.1 hypothetical protein JOB18_010464 [Solea senegalensis]